MPANSTSYEESIFNIISTFFVNNYYNAIYVTAKDCSVSNGRSLTENYISLVREFIQVTHSDPESYKRIVKELCAYYERTIGLAAVAFGEFETKLVEIFVPREFWNHLNTQHRVKTVHFVICEVAKSIGMRIIRKEQLIGVIDQRKDFGLVEDLKHWGVLCLRVLREDLHVQFASQSVNAQNGGTGMSQDKMQRIHALFEKVAKEKLALQVNVSNLQAENARLRSSLERALAMLKANAVTPAPIASPTPMPAPSPLPTPAPVPTPAPAPIADPIISIFEKQMEMVTTDAAPAPQVSLDAEYGFITPEPPVTSSAASSSWSDALNLGDEELQWN